MGYAKAIFDENLYFYPQSNNGDIHCTSKWCEYLRENQNVTIVSQDRKTMARSQRSNKRHTTKTFSFQMSYMNSGENLEEIT